MEIEKIMKAFTDCHAIKVSGKNYTPSIFIKCGSSVYAYNKHICISGPMLRKDLTPEKLRQHLQTMINDGLKIEII